MHSAVFAADASTPVRPSGAGAVSVWLSGCRIVQLGKGVVKGEYCLSEYHWTLNFKQYGFPDKGFHGGR